MLVPNDIQQGDNVGPARQVLQDLDLPLDLLLLDGLQDLDDTLLIVGDIDAFEDLRVLSSSCGRDTLLAFHFARGRKGS